MSATGRYRVQGPDVTHETIDGEVVIINLDTGNYYSLTGTGTVVWTMLSAGVSIEAIAERLGHRHDVPGGQAMMAIGPLVAALEAERLIAPEASDAPIGILADELLDGVDGPLVAPILQKYNDMQDLLLLDPIHDVAESGWPNKE